ncbi:MAG TPA: Dabb family protein [Solirubrobacter sp.]|jgi:heme-degrading monooxygenase HmoA|nr:Dabb family protein [Solirubrobacter sp.]
MPTLTDGRIRHGVVFTLKHPEGSEAEADFLRANAALADIPGVEAFELMREVSPKNPYRFALTMEFANRDAYEAYNQHPDHVKFVSERWMNEVSEFMETDSQAL